jgi:hypothetical protein
MCFVCLKNSQVKVAGKVGRRGECGRDEVQNVMKGLGTRSDTIRLATYFLQDLSSGSWKVRGSRVAG